MIHVPQVLEYALCSVEDRLRRTNDLLEPQGILTTPALDLLLNRVLAGVVRDEYIGLALDSVKTANAAAQPA